MTSITDPSSIRPSILGATFIFSRAAIRERKAAFPETVGEALEIFGAKKSQSYAMVGAVEEALAAIGVADDPPSPRDDTGVEITKEVCDFLMRHPGCVASRGGRTTYSESFRLFVLSFLDEGRPGHDMTVKDLASATRVPLGTLKDWLKAGSVTKDEQQPSCPAPPSCNESMVATIVTEWPKWEGTFTEFCRHLRAHHRIEAKNTFIAHVLEAFGLRIPDRKDSTPPWSRKSFEELFPDAQWLGDGSAFFVDLDGERFVFNLEAIVDASTNAVLACEVSDVEDEASVLNAFEQARQVTRTTPVGFSVDNKPSNHTARIEEHVDPARLLASTPFRPTTKASVEGFFGLFEQQLPPLEVSTTSGRRELARSILELIATAYGRGRNGRPRKKLGGISPADAHLRHQPTPEELERAKQWMQELAKRREKMQRTRRRRGDPVSRRLIEEALDRFGIADPDGAITRALSTYTTEAIGCGIAIFAGKTDTGTLPNLSDPGRYLGGIIRNEQTRIEQLAIADALLEVRLRQRDVSLEPLHRQVRHIDASTDEAARRIIALTDRALECDPEIDFRFFTRMARDRLAALRVSQARALFRTLSRRIAARFSTSAKRRQTLLCELSSAIPSAA